MKTTMTDVSSPEASNFARTNVRIYRRDDAAEQSTSKLESSEAPIDAANDMGIEHALQSMLTARKLQRDLLLLAEDPSKLPNFDQLPAQVQAIAAVDPMSFLMLRQLADSGVDLHAIVTLHDRMQQELDAALRAEGWDGARPLTDAELDRAGEMLRRLMEE